MKVLKLNNSYDTAKVLGNDESWSPPTPLMAGVISNGRSLSNST